MPWKPGQSGNPGGAPRNRSPFKRELLFQLEGGHKLVEVVKSLIAAAIDGDMNAVKIIRDSIDGLPRQQVEVTERSNDGIGRRLDEFDVPQLERILKLVESEASSGEKEPDSLH